MTGLYRLYHQEPKEIVNFWHTGYEDFNLDDTTDDEWEDSPYDKRDWETYKRLRDGNGVPKSLLNRRESAATFSCRLYLYCWESISFPTSWRRGHLFPFWYSLCFFIRSSTERTGMFSPSTDTNNFFA